MTAQRMTLTYLDHEEEFLKSFEPFNSKMLYIKLALTTNMFNT